MHHPALPALLETLYAGATESPPWHSFAAALRLALQARNVGITLRHDAGNGRDVYVMAGIPDDPLDWEHIESVYRADFMALDPDRPAQMAHGEIRQTNLHDPHQRQHSFFRALGIAHNLRICCEATPGTRCWIDVVRGTPTCTEAFTPDDRQLLELLLPHLTRALSWYATLKRQEVEKTIYESLLEHFAIGCVLLNRRGHVVHCNPIALRQCTPGAHVALQQKNLRLQDPKLQKQLDACVQRMVQHPEQAAAHDGQLIKMGGSGDHLLGLLVHSAPRPPYDPGEHSPCVVIYLIDLPVRANQAVHRPHALQRVMHLFDLTPQEANLALLLMWGHSIAQAATHMGIAETAARNYTKRIYAKVGITSQADLIRLLLRSLPLLQ